MCAVLPPKPARSMKAAPLGRKHYNNHKKIALRACREAASRNFRTQLG
ncbi:hypothetical protein BSIN_4248 [Burkholderia singularis]|uniref:Uncharacterized protein n=1 Tax=Burkholderia singularis TaxID=1503053 RepID=A0A238H7I9_9BURK|nr:hypothetical protein BSIN_4248 [Burkholderia singularis]